MDILAVGGYEYLKDILKFCMLVGHTISYI
jgi:hypothetical protein